MAAALMTVTAIVQQYRVLEISISHGTSCSEQSLDGLSDGVAPTCTGQDGATGAEVGSFQPRPTTVKDKAR